MYFLHESFDVDVIYEIKSVVISDKDTELFINVFKLFAR